MAREDFEQHLKTKNSERRFNRIVPSTQPQGCLLKCIIHRVTHSVALKKTKHYQEALNPRGRLQNAQSDIPRAKRCHLSTILFSFSLPPSIRTRFNQKQNKKIFADKITHAFNFEVYARASVFFTAISSKHNKGGSRQHDVLKCDRRLYFLFFPTTRHLFATETNLTNNNK